ncbi:hypothetical protein CXG81DRAFT_15468 [Caulochytrium protostelioides]|uniref:DNA-directed RNA polymerase III subunit RPC3 n=1 Tax=Caulochytrium protostelioides TaxID=1555241 RepID=A0A4P9X2N4_9FUNG|nr:hypothetical protein CXG81DRAFT_15468 [Caulochytrium protostelioides]|eukprot:RKO98766.1 hypothetical protein CXG81DRAFT_15468 [Caulochytrium protostelioides]
MAELRQANERLSQVATFALQKYGGHLAPRYGGGGNGSGEAWDSNDVRTATAGTIPGKRPYNGALFDLGDEDLGFDLQGAATKRARTAHGATATAADDAAGAADETDQGAQRLTQLAKTPFFAVNTDRLHILMRSTILARHASLRINKRAGAVYEAVLDTVFDDIGGVKPEPGTAAAAVTAAAGATPLVAVPVPFNPYALPMERLQDFLDALAADSMGFLVPASEASDLHGGSGAMGAAGGYRVAFDRLRPQLLARYMETFITDRFGRIAARLWRCLLAKGRLEERHLAKLLLVPEKAAREVLYQLLEAGLVFLQDVPRSADHAAQRTYFLWFVDIPASTARLAQRTARTLGNVKQRYAALLRQRAHLVAKLERSDVKLGIAQLSDREQVMAKDLERRQNALHAAELRLLEGLLLLEDL